MRKLHEKDPYYGLLDLTSVRIGSRFKYKDKEVKVILGRYPELNTNDRITFTCADKENNHYCVFFTEDNIYFSEETATNFKHNDIPTKISKLMFNGCIKPLNQEEKNIVEDYFTDRYNHFKQEQN